jgi:hypothetical protein
MMWVWGNLNAFVISFTGPGGYPADYYARSASLSAAATGKHIFHAVLDTTQAVQTNRLVLYMDGSPLAVNNTSLNIGTQAIPQNATIDIPRPGLSHGFTSGPGFDQVVSLGNYPNYYAGQGEIRGKIYYAAIHADALTQAEIKSAAGRILGKN